MLILCVFLLCGCANIEYMRVTDDTGKIVDKLTVELNETELATKLNAVQILSLKADIASDFKDYKDNIEYAKGVLGKEHLDLNFELGITVQTTGWLEMGQGVSKIAIEITYANSQFLALLYGDGDDEEASEPNITSDWFISKYLIENENVFAGIEDSEYFSRYTSRYDEFSISDLNLTQVYGTTDDRLKSNADYKDEINGINYHLWEIGTENGEYKTMKLGYYYITAVGTGWYVIALSVSVAVALVLVVVSAIKTHNDKKYRTKVKGDNDGR